MSTRLKSLLLTCWVMLIWTNVSNAQTWTEWFSQKKTQQSYLLEQVAALKLYAGYLKKGYEIGSSGLNFIKDATKGEFDLHGTFFSSLKSVSPEIKKNSRIAAIIQMQLQIGSAFSSVKGLGDLGTQNQEYVKLVGGNLLTKCLRDMEELLLVITAGKLEMTEDERFSEIERIYKSMQDKKSFAFRFCAAVQSLSGSRSQKIKDLNKMEEWYEN